jgi:hypothetical protein
MLCPGGFSDIRTARFVCVLALFTLGCAEHVPDQDLRILQAAPAAKLTTDLLWKEFQADARAATRRYHGRAIEVSGKVTGIVPDQPPARLMFDPSTTPDPSTTHASTGGIEARVLDDRAAETFKDLSVGQRVTIRCFVEGMAGTVILKSCIKKGT